MLFNLISFIDIYKTIMYSFIYIDNSYIVISERVLNLTNMKCLSVSICYYKYGQLFIIIDYL